MEGLIFGILRYLLCLEIWKSALLLLSIFATEGKFSQLEFSDKLISN